MDPIIENEQAESYAISTINWQVPKNWFYKELIEFEQGMDSEGVAFRITIDDVDTNIISLESRERSKRSLKDRPEKYYAELYATLAQMKKVFSISTFFLTVPTVTNITEYII
jgi:hypothetical protein